VTEVAKGIGLDDRIGPKFPQAGVGFGGSWRNALDPAAVRSAGLVYEGIGRGPALLTSRPR
jgi:UDP-glucose/GDP-mannose dehydrogenase family, central domain